MKFEACIETLLEEVGCTVGGIPPGATTVAKLLFGSIPGENTTTDVVDTRNSRSKYGYGLPENLEHASPENTIGHSPGMVYRSAVAIVSRTFANKSEILHTRTQRERLAQAIIQTIDEELTREEAGRAVDMLYRGTESEREELIVQLAEVARNERSEFSTRPRRLGIGNRTQFY